MSTRVCGSRKEVPNPDTAHFLILGFELFEFRWRWNGNLEEKTVILNRGRAYYCILRPDDMMGIGSRERACFLSTHLLNGLNLPQFSTPRSPHYALITYHQSADVPPHVGFIYFFQYQILRVR